MQYPLTQYPIHSTTGHTSQLQAYKHRIIYICVLASN